MTLRGAVGRWDHLVGAILAAGFVATLVGTEAGLAMTRDESFYTIAAESYGRWFERLWSDPGAAVERATIDPLWEYNHEHPGLVKSAFALSLLAHEKLGLFARPGLAVRLPGMLCAGLILWVTYLFGARVRSRVAGLVAALLVACMPRFFYHAHLACFDVPIVLMLEVVTYAYWRSLERHRWALAVGVGYGLALATKHNAWVLPGILLIHFAVVQWDGLVRRREGASPPPVRAPSWLLAMLLVGPPIFVATWPWIWHDTVERVRWYASFHLGHEYYNTAYFGTTYFRPPFPRTYPWVMTAFTVPATTLVLAVCGVALSARRLLPLALLGRARAPLLAEDPRRAEILWFGVALATVGLFSTGSTPIFGGTKHWLLAYPFVALFAGLAVDTVVAGLRAAVARRGAPSGGLRGRIAHAAPFALVLLVLAPGAAETVRSAPFGLAHYTLLAGGTEGAATHGMLRQFWGYTQGALAGWFRDALPGGGTVWTCDATWKAWEMMQRDGMIPASIRAAPTLAGADFALVHHEHHFAEVDFQIWEAFGTIQPATVLTHEGVPLVSVYENPRRRQR